MQNIAIDFFALMCKIISFSPFSLYKRKMYYSVFCKKVIVLNLLNVDCIIHQLSVSYWLVSLMSCVCWFCESVFFYGATGDLEKLLICCEYFVSTGLQVSWCHGQTWCEERRSCGHLHAHDSTDCVLYAGLCKNRSHP